MNKFTKSNIFSFACMLLMCFCSQSCSNDTEELYPGKNYTKADLLVASSEFQTFQENLVNFAENVSVKYKKCRSLTKMSLKKLQRK